VVDQSLMTGSTIWQHGFNLPCQTWCALNHFHIGQGLVIVITIITRSAETILSAQNDRDGQHISTDQWVGGCCHSESDPATCFLGDLEDVSRYHEEASKRDLVLKGLMSQSVIPKSGYMTKEAVVPSDD